VILPLSLLDNRTFCSFPFRAFVATIAGIIVANFIGVEPLSGYLVLDYFVIQPFVLSILVTPQMNPLFPGLDESTILQAPVSDLMSKVTYDAAWRFELQASAVD